LKAVFMIELIMHLGIGFLAAALLAGVLGVLVVVPFVHGRAVRLTTWRLEAAIPLSMAEIKANKDLLRAEFAMSTRHLERNIEQIKTRSTGQFAELGKNGNAINRLKIEIGVLRNQLRATEEEVAVKATAVQKAEHALSDKESKLIGLMGELEERSALADVQKIEIIALKIKVESLKGRPDAAGDELNTVGDGANSERTELEAVTQKLMEERGKFVNFHRRVAELVQLLMAQTSEDENLGYRVKDLENRLVDQSRLLDESEAELKHLRGDIESARKAEADLRRAIIEIDGRASAAIQTLEAEKAKLQTALDRANGERVRLAYELTNMKRQPNETQAANGPRTRCCASAPIDVATEGARQAAYDLPG
jgi:chromosome segregation ATPase